MKYKKTLVGLSVAVGLMTLAIRCGQELRPSVVDGTVLWHADIDESATARFSRGHFLFEFRDFAERWRWQKYRADDGVFEGAGDGRVVMSDDGTGGASWEILHFAKDNVGVTVSAGTRSWRLLVTSYAQQSCSLEGSWIAG